MIAVAGPAMVARSLERLTEAGLLDVPTRAVALDDEGRLEDAAEAAGVRVLWRHGAAWPTAWVRAALESLPDLEWMHSDMAGADGLPLTALASRGIAVTRGAGNFSRVMAEWVVLHMLAAAKRYPQFLRQSDAREWRTIIDLGELDGSVALVLGLGSIGREVAALLTPFGVVVEGAVRRPRPDLPPGVRRVLIGDEWRDALPRADFVILTLPLTERTRGLLDEAALAAMRPGAWIINVARGALVDEAALTAALDAGRLGGAALDAFVDEPLPADSPLWGRDNVIVTPHNTWASTRVWERVGATFAGEMSRFATGRPLRHTVDLEAGY